jgi:tRNA (guanine26-N2/guanine27-N2)-dimethyltransferase
MHRETDQKIFGKSILCPECGGKMDYAGPLWIGNIEDSLFIDQLIKENQNTAFKNCAKITKILTLTKNEAALPPTYFVIDKLSGKLKLPAPSNQEFLTRLQNGGFQAVPTHFNPRGIKTNASALIMQKLLRETVATKVK